MSDSINKAPSESEIRGRFDASNQIYGLGINIGVKSYENLITISSAALGLLFSFRQGFFSGSVQQNLSFPETLLWFLAIVGFAITVLSSIKRNYHAGNELVNLSHFMRNRAFKKLHPNKKIYGQNETDADAARNKAVKYRKRWSQWAKISFYWAISSLAGFLVIDDVLNFFSSIIEKIPNLALFLVPIIINIIASFAFAKSQDSFEALPQTEKKSNPSKRRSVSKKKSGGRSQT